MASEEEEETCERGSVRTGCRKVIYDLCVPGPVPAQA